MIAKFDSLYPNFICLLWPVRSHNTSAASRSSPVCFEANLDLRSVLPRPGFLDRQESRPRVAV
jgi:hypothetical protein